jgi:hypothetical protein
MNMYRHSASCVARLGVSEGGRAACCGETREELRSFRGLFPREPGAELTLQGVEVSEESQPK